MQIEEEKGNALQMKKRLNREKTRLVDAEESTAKA